MICEDKRKPVLLFAGTSEGRELAQWLTEKGYQCIVSVATAYGEMVMGQQDSIQILEGRMDRQQMQKLLENGTYGCVIDATHPFATKVSSVIFDVCTNMQIPVYRVSRETKDAALDMLERQLIGKGLLHFVKNTEEAAAYTAPQEGTIFLTTGSKELTTFVANVDSPDRIYARVLPSMESLTLCEKAEITGKQIIAMQGPFSTAMNLAMLEQIKPAFLVTKQTGQRGGYQEKLEAALSYGCKVVVIENPEKEQYRNYSETEIRQLFCRDAAAQKRHISLVGIGMGNTDTMTGMARKILEQAQVVFGAKRIIESFAAFHINGKSEAIYQKDAILDYLEKHPEYTKIAVAYSGDTGFYSGAASFRDEALENKYDLEYIPGISSVVYFASKLGIAWQDITLCSAHGRTCNVMGAVKRHEKCFFLLTDVEELQNIGRHLLKMQEDLKISYGYQLSYEEEEVGTGKPEMLLSLEKKGLYVLLVERSYSPVLTPGIMDTLFLRDKVPMTKEEVREISLCKLQLTRDAIVYDVGAGTGSVSIECATICERGHVYALEQKKQAVALLEQNKEHFLIENLTVIEAKAPKGFESLPIPSHVFIGGSSGNMKEILQTLLAKTADKIRVVINAVTLETVAEVNLLVKEIPCQNLDIVQISAAKAKAVGAYHLMEAMNPVTIFSFDMMGEKQ